MKNCEICGKPTKSHKIGYKYVCHTCWVDEDNEEQIEELEEEIKKREMKRSRTKLKKD